MTPVTDNEPGTPADLPKWLRTIPFFRSLDDAQLARVIDAGQMMRFAADHQLIGHGQREARLYLLCRGEMSATFDERGGELRVGPGLAFCSAALFDDVPVGAAVATSSDCELFVLAREDFSRLLFADGQLLDALLEGLDRVRRNLRLSLETDSSEGLRGSPIFVGLDQGAARLLSAMGESAEHAAGAEVVVKDQTMALILVESGTFELRDRERTLRQLGPGAIIGTEGLLSTRRAEYGLVCRSPGRTVSLSRARFIKALGASPPLFTQVFSAFAEWQDQPRTELAGGEGRFERPQLNGAELGERLRRSELFSQWSDDQLQALLDQVRYRWLGRGELLFGLGDPGDAMYLIVDGAIQVRFRGRDGQFTDLATLNPGETVGEMALIDDQARSADAVAMVDTELLSLDQAGFQGLLNNSPKLISALLIGLSGMLRQSNQWRISQVHPEQITSEDALQRVTFFNLLDAESRHILADAGRELELAAGELLFEEGDPPDSMYVILRGSVSVIQTLEEGGERELAHLKTGDVFGEMAMIDGEARSASARTREPSVFFALDRNVFVLLLAQTPPLLTQVLKGLSEKVRQANIENRKLQQQFA